VFHSDGTGGYLIYAEWPGRRVYIDDRAELFVSELPEFVAARAGRPVWREVFAREGFEEALLREEDTLTDILRASGWQARSFEGGFVVLRRPHFVEGAVDSDAGEGRPYGRPSPA